MLHTEIDMLKTHKKNSPYWTAIYHAQRAAEIPGEVICPYKDGAWKSVWHQAYFEARQLTFNYIECEHDNTRQLRHDRAC